MQTTSEKQGLCLTCLYGADCVFQRGVHTAILQCEQFEAAESAPATHRTAEAEFEPADVADGPAGLCMNCDFRKTCTYPKPPGGVWRCEEYR